MSYPPHVTPAARPPDALVLCGGRSRRFGSDKARFVVEGRPLLQRVVEALLPVARRVLLVVDRPARYPELGLQEVVDEEPHRGPLHALPAALDHAEGDAAFVVSCDMPYLVPELFTTELERLGTADACFPWHGDTCVPLAGLYRRSVAGRARQAVAAGAGRLMDLVETLSVSRLTAEDLRDLPARLLVNVNAPGDLAHPEGRP